MFDVNVKILSELKNFITIVSGNRAILDKFCNKAGDFTRTRKLPFGTLSLLIIKLSKKTLSLELERFFADMKTNMPCSVSAFTQQRVKLHSRFFYYWNMVLWGSYYLYAGAAVKRWRGYRVIGADGSSVSLINNPALSRYFGGQRNQSTSFVLAQTFYYYDVLNELILVPQIAPYRYGELNMAYNAITEVEEDMLMIYDRNFCNYKMVALHLWQEKERKFVIRAKETQNTIRSFIESGQSTAIVDLPPTASAIAGLKKSGYVINTTTLLSVRLVRVELDKTVEVLMTNLWEEEGYATDQFKELYFKRWAIETNIAIQKNVLQLESFSGLTVNAVLQDFYATVIMTNLHAVLIKDAQKTVDETIHRKHPMKVNKNKSFGKLKVTLVSLFIENEVNTILQLLHDHFIRDLLPVRKGRSFPRVRKNVNSKSKYRTYTNFKPAY